MQEAAHAPRVSDLWLAEEPIDHVRHVCGFFRTPQEAYELLLPFMKDGLDRGEGSLYIVDSERRDEHLRLLTAAGIDAASAERSGQLEVLGWDHTYLSSGYFSQDAMLQLVDQRLGDGQARGFKRTRVVGHMEWVLKGVRGAEDLLEYETRVNYVMERHDDPVICAYDLGRFGAGLIVDILRTHPWVIIGGTVQENPFFVPPAEMLEELRTRYVA
jgi:hypothetical protein